MSKTTYASAGVNIDAANAAVKGIEASVLATHNARVLGSLGGFGGMFAFDAGCYRQPVLVSSTDSVGTKVKIAAAAGRNRGIGIDLVNHCINDILCCGANPLYFLDYFATSTLDQRQLTDVVAGISDACQATACALIGGETAELPGMYNAGEYDIAGFITGVVERDDVIDGSRVRPGDVIVGLPSNGLHTNGYSLVRHILESKGIDVGSTLPGTDAPLVDLLLQPHTSYLPAITELRSRADIKALAHITGGGLEGNVVRVLPQGVTAVIDRSTWRVPPLFGALQQAGDVEESDMWRTLNMGIGMVAIISAGSVLPATVDGMELIPIGTITQSANESAQVIVR